MSIFKASELVNLAILVERNGEDFYNSLKQIIENKDAQKVFSYLADEEKKHIATFQGLLKNLEKYQQGEIYEEDYKKYMKAMADSHVFINKSGKEFAQNIKSFSDAISIAMKFEKDSILFFEGMKQFVPESEHKTINELANEERKHIVKLIELRGDI